MAQLWGGRFTKETDKLVYNFTRLNMPAFVIILAASVANRTGVVLASTEDQKFGEIRNSILLIPPSQMLPAPEAVHSSVLFSS